MSADQITKHREVKACGGCSQSVVHTQVAVYSKASGFKSYELVPQAHRRLDGTRCTFKADLRKNAWLPNQ